MIKMKHRVKKFQFKKGKDATRSTLRKLALNLIRKGRLETNLKKAKALRSFIDRLVYKAKEKSGANKNVLLKQLSDKKAVNKLFAEVGPIFKKRTGGFVRIIRTGSRFGDGSEMARVEWTKPVIEVKSEKSKVKSTTKKLKADKGETKDKKGKVDKQAEKKDKET